MARFVPELSRPATGAGTVPAPARQVYLYGFSDVITATGESS